MSVQRALELGILANAVKTRVNMGAVVKQLNGYQFTDQVFSWFWDKCKTAWSKGEMIRLVSLEAQAKAEPEDVQDVAIETIIEVYKAEPSPSPQTDIETLRTYHRQVAIVKGMDRATKAVQRGDIDGASEMLKRVSTEAAPSTGLKVSAVLDFDDWANANTIRGIETGLRTFDEVTMGGMRPMDVGIIMGVTGMGKSLLGSNFGYNGFKHRRRTLHIDSENGLQETQVRYVARATRLTARALTRRGLDYSDDFKRWAERQKNRIHEYLRILHIGVDQATMSEVEAKISELCDDGWDPEEIIFDTVDHVVWEGSFENSGMIAKMQYASVKSIAQRYNAVVWEIIQAKQEAEGKIATNKHAAWGYDKARLADAVLSINPGLDDRGNPLSEREMGDSRSLFVSKARKFPGRFIIPLKTDFPTSYISEQLAGDQDEQD